MATGKNFASQFKLDDLQKNLDQNKWDKISALFSTNHPFQIDPNLKNGDLTHHIIDKLEVFQAEIGVTAAVSAHKLMMHLMAKHRDKAKEQLEDLKKEIAAWNRSLKVRLFQQFLYVLSFGLSMAALPLTKIGAAILTSADNWAMAGANAIPLYMDIKWPFKRNTPVVVPPVNMEDLPLLGMKA